jgi:hypothetical protein
MVADFGQGGVTCTSGAATVAGGRFYVLKCVTDTVFVAISENGCTGSRRLLRKAGDEIFGDITGYQTTSGGVEAYHK